GPRLRTSLTGCITTRASRGFRSGDEAGSGARRRRRAQHSFARNALDRAGPLRAVAGLADVDDECGGFLVAAGVSGGEGVGGGFPWGDADAAAVRGPHGVDLGIELHRFRVRHAVAKLGAIAALDGCGRGVKIQMSNLPPPIIASVPWSASRCLAA